MLKKKTRIKIYKIQVLAAALVFMIMSQEGQSIPAILYKDFNFLTYQKNKLGTTR